MESNKVVDFETAVKLSHEIYPDSNDDAHDGNAIFIMETINELLGDDQES